MSKSSHPNRGYLAAIMSGYCPRCREGRLFEKAIGLQRLIAIKMHKQCPVCGQPTEIEVGFYYGTGYVSYLLAVIICLLSALVWWLTIGFSTEDMRVVLWLVCNGLLLLALQPWLMRFSRSLWLSWFVKYNPNWRTEQPEDVSERQNQQQANNW